MKMTVTIEVESIKELRETFMNGAGDFLKFGITSHHGSIKASVPPKTEAEQKAEAAVDEFQKNPQAATIPIRVSK